MFTWLRSMMLDYFGYHGYSRDLTLCSPFTSPVLYEHVGFPCYKEHGISYASWTSTIPEQWCKWQVWEWLQFCCDQYKLDANCIPFSKFNLSGKQLCSMTLQQFISIAGDIGEVLHSVLEQIKGKGTSRWEKNSQHHTGSRRFCNSPTAVDGLQREYLWEFIRDLLLSPEESSGILEWEDRREGIFKVVKTDSLARLWGQRKKNEHMTYEKLSRALRHYYKTGILERVDRRLMYKFGRNAYGWR
ncbi:ETS homologous factor [Pristis pectinata]|uniref:ETS homologous factor n=1 Tax=Pristis pectinata TaxID=685728 RepID=UPI00223E35D1|nr:ETS homologous factor [Pristis pectinata]